MNASTATAARNGDPTASMPKMISETPHKMDNVEACRTIPDEVCCAINTSSNRDERSILTHGLYPKELQERHHAACSCVSWPRNTPALCAVIVSPAFRRLMEMGASPDLRHWS